ncbi:hypothetical protein ACFYPN_28255 [Streptomyces sp. NPDC005576]|uniref:hypothetical protein n=1 Tax=unclassified Streptomyces TaxID=2593676 RepID=UPI0033C384BF
MEDRPVRTAQRVLALIAAASTLPGLAIGLPTGMFWIFLLAATPVAVPVLLRDEPQPFAWASLIVGTSLLAGAVVGALLGMFLFVPTALMLLAIAFMDSRARPSVLWAVAALGIPAASGLVFYGTYDF